MAAVPPPDPAPPEQPQPPPPRLWPRLVVLGTANAGLAARFARSGIDRFDGVRWRAQPDGLPVLEGSQASISCKVTLVTNHGTHTIFVGEVLRVRFSNAIDPLLYLDGAFGRFLLKNDSEVK